MSATFREVEKAALGERGPAGLAATAAAAGAQLVIGARRTCCSRSSAKAQLFVAYSLGNFVFGAVSEETTATGILGPISLRGRREGARWRQGTISGGRPQLERKRPQPLPVDDPAAMTAGVTLW